MFESMKKVWWMAAVAGTCLYGAEPAWPTATNEMRPWCYNWWMGNAVDAAGLERQAKDFEASGFGGFHAIPIYEVKDARYPEVKYLSPEWTQLFNAGKRSALGHGLELDLSTGCGWCFGGPWLTPEQGIWRLQRETDPKRLKKGAKVLWKGKDAKGRPLFFAAFPSGMLVKRAPASGRGPMMDPYSPEVMRAHLAPFTAAFDRPGAAKPRSMYHDSYEYYGAAWTPKFFEAFQAKRGYDLRDHLAAFAGVGKEEEIRRVKHDYRETLSDLILDTFTVWTDWCRARGMRTRNEAHGAPANWLDFYALADIPETEMFNKDRDILVSKFSSSAAHLKGTPLVASESCTWINEHFNATLDEVQVFLNQLLLAGVNHVFYHGCCYSPVEAAWPGWCFYASLEMNPRNPIWRDAAVLNRWLTRVQSLAQTSTPDEDVLIYWPIHDFWSTKDGYVKEMSVHNKWFAVQPFGRLARRLYDAGVSFDYVSDRLLTTLPPASQSHWKTIVIPACETMPVATAQTLVRLSKSGYRIVFDGTRPTDVPGLKADAASRQALASALASIPGTVPASLGTVPTQNGESLGTVPTKNGESLGTVPTKMVEGCAELAQVGRCEPFTKDSGLAYRRFRRGADTLYFVVNNSQNDVAGTYVPTAKFKQAWSLDPMTGAIKPMPSKGGLSLALPAGESIWLWLSPEGGQPPEVARGQTPATDRGQSPEVGRGQTLATDRGQTPVMERRMVEVKGPWTLTPVCGGPEEAAKASWPRTMKKLTTWSRNEDGSENPFCGTVCYRTTFTWYPKEIDPAETGKDPAKVGTVPKAKGTKAMGTDPKTMGTDPAQMGTDPLELDLGTVCHSARVRVNGQDIGARIRKPYKFMIPRKLMKIGENVLEVEVTSTAANRIRDLDRRKVEWKIFGDINIVGRDYKPFDAAQWPLVDAGLLGPVWITEKVPVPSRKVEKNAGKLRVVEPVRCEGLTDRNAVGVRCVRPRFTWALAGEELDVRPLGAEVRLEASYAALTRGVGKDKLVWSKVVTNELFSCQYDGPALLPGVKYNWQVRLVHADGSAATDWSLPYRFVVALQSDADWEGAQWVGEPNYGRGWTNFDYTVKFTLLKDAFGVYFRTKADRLGYMWQINTKLDPKKGALLRPHVFCAKGKLRFFEPVELNKFFPQGLDWKQPHRLRIAAAGETIRTFLDEVLVHTCTDREHAAGTFGLRTADAEEVLVHAVTLKTDRGEILQDDFKGAESRLFSRAHPKNGALHLAGGQVYLHGTDIPKNAPQLRKTFLLPKKSIRQAIVSACGFGFYELWLNGKKVDESRVLAPGMTSAGRGALFDTYDVTYLLESGENTIGFWLAPGYSDDFSRWGWHWERSKRAILHLNIDYVDGSHETIVTDGSWEVKQTNEIVRTGIYSGETVDARLADPDWCRPCGTKDGWQPVAVLPASEAPRLVANDAPPVRRFSPITILPDWIVERKPGVFVARFEANQAGVVEVRVKGPRGTTIRLHTSELADKDGNIEPWTNRRAESTDVFTLAGTGEMETFIPRFTYHGFQYVEVTGWPGRPERENLSLRVIHADVEETATFHDSGRLDHFVYAAQRSMLSNFMSYPTDCAMRDERTPCQMDSQAYEDAALQMFEMTRYYSKWLDDIRGERGNPDWTGDQVTLALRLYRATGDKRILERNYANIQGQIADDVRKWPKLICPTGFGDWCAPNQGSWETYFNDVPLVNSALFCKMLQDAAEAAEALGKEADAQSYRELRARAVAAFNVEFFNATKKTYGDGSQATFVLPLAFDLVPPSERAAVTAKLVETIHTADKNRINVGIYGMRYLGDVLCDAGEHDLFYHLMTQREYPGFGYMFARGSSTLWEQWTERGGMNSHNHAMFAGALYSVMTRLVGIEAAPYGRPAVRIRPWRPGGIGPTWIEATRTLPQGKVELHWWWRYVGTCPAVYVRCPPYVAVE